MAISPKRVLLKISGEALGQGGISSNGVTHLIHSIKSLLDQNIQIAIVLGGGNFFRGGSEFEKLSINRAAADQAGMLATVMNALILTQALAHHSIPSKILSSFKIEGMTEKYSWDKGRSALDKGNVLICPGGTGLPFFTTDTAAALRAVELKADLLLKATTHVDGVYDKDPRKHQDAKRFEKITYKEYIEKNLGVMDITAITLCQQHNIPVLVFDSTKKSFSEILDQPMQGTIVV
jgi:uridylate kinase